VRNLQNDIAKQAIEIVILAVPAKVAQEIADIVVSSGVRAILSFAPVNIKTPENIHIRTEDMTMELEYLTYALVNGK
ncbi:MAG: redox-sensing transcriptional repressor Rex, partial [candidate division Zixibacteria bacterium]|nr:redox-sensing transcriptional repressor Rex [candidate division Zixibacteria bacterium]